MADLSSAGMAELADAVDSKEPAIILFSHRKTFSLYKIDIEESFLVGKFGIDGD